MSEEECGVLEVENYDQIETRKQLESLFPSLISTYTDIFESFNLVEDYEYQNYNISGDKAASLVFTFEVHDAEYAGWIVGSLIGNKFFILQFIADPSQFDANLPNAEKMLRSIKVLDN